MQQDRVLKDSDGNVLTSFKSMMERRNGNLFLMNEEKVREHRVHEVAVVEKEVAKISKDEDRKALKRRKGR